MNWNTYLKQFISFLLVEKNLSKNTAEAYKTDVEKIILYISENDLELDVETITYNDLSLFITWINQFNLNSNSQARMITGIKSFFNYLVYEDIIKTSPAELLESPKISRKLPVILNYIEIDNIINQANINKQTGERNKAIIDTLYSCGLRVSELTNMKLSNLRFNERLILIEGKGNKERLIPIGRSAINNINNYIDNSRKTIKIKKEFEDYLFLSINGEKLSKVTISEIIKEITKSIGLKKKVTPHTFRHSYATHLIEDGCNINDLKNLLGHESITTTELYVQLNTEFLRINIENHHPRSGKKTKSV